MLDLQSDRWCQLHYAYGPADAVPDAIRLLLAGRKTLNDACDGLVFKAETYSASLAAFPHIVKYLHTATTSESVDAILLLGRIHSWDHEARHNCPDDIFAWYEDAIQPAGTLAVSTFSRCPLDDTTAMHLFEALAMLNHCDGDAHMIASLANDEIVVGCPHCDQELFFWPADKDFGFNATDGSNTDFGRVKIEPVNIGDVSSDAVTLHSFEWMFVLCQTAGYPGLADSLRFLFGVKTCPECNGRF